MTIKKVVSESLILWKIAVVFVTYFLV